jgi:hypothetical protein
MKRSVVLGLVVALLFHADWHIARPTHHRWSLGVSLSTTVQPRLAARVLAAALIESIDWWVDHESISAAEIDTAFHLLARTVIANSRSA